MCRLLGYCARGSTSLAEVMGEQGLREFTRLSEFHGDGWGMAWYDEALRLHKSPLRASDEPAYHTLAHSSLGDLGLVHLRWATPGLPVEPSNTHPFRRGDVVMAHNGAIHPQDRLGDLLPPAWERRLTGTTDSERYFLHVMSGLEAHGGDMIAALDDTAARVDEMFSANSLNAVFLTPDALYAVCFYHPGRIPHDALASRGHDGPTERYFDMAYRETEHAVVVASSGWSQDGWTHLPNRHVLVVDRDTLQAKVVPLGAAGAAGGPLPVLVGTVRV
ncbi:MAG TPA: class II glutamine amidotransferase [Streptosporangiaceae bacterium]|nr:class II glutamine amidotransferase [Streptosporangiaceae bacterium]